MHMFVCAHTDTQTQTQSHTRTHPHTQGVKDHEQFFERDVFRSGLGGLCDPSLVRILSTKSADAIHWLMEELDVPLTVLSQLGGHSRKRTHRAPDKKVCFFGCLCVSPCHVLSA